MSAETAKAERLRQWLVESWPHDDVTPREIVQSGPNALREGKALQGPLSMLVKAGHLVSLEPGTVSRHSGRCAQGSLPDCENRPCCLMCRPLLQKSRGLALLRSLQSGRM